MTKLRDGEQTLGVVLPPEDKLEIPRALEEAGIDRIEAGFPRVSDDDYAARAADRPGRLRAEVWFLTRRTSGRRGAR
jgi:isopropylmalate/homocitrate/citramalate synthase